LEDGAGNIVNNENGNGPMDITEEENPFKLEELASYSVCLAAKNKAVSNGSNQVPVKTNQTKNKTEASVVASQSLSIKGNRVSNEIKANAVDLVGVHPKNSARAVALQLKLEPRTAQQPTATIEQLMDQLTSSFEGLSLSKRTVYRYLADLWIFTLKGIQLELVKRSSPERILARKEWVEGLGDTDVDYMIKCVFIDEAGFNANLRRSQGWSPKGQPAIVKVLTARASSISSLDATSAKGLIKVCL